MIWRLCLENGYHYMETRNINENELSKDGLHLQSSNQKKKLSPHFIVKLQTYDTFLEKQTWSPNTGRREALV